MQTWEIIYIATGYHYICYFDNFIKDLEKFCTNKIYKKVKLLTDMEDYDISQYKKYNNIDIELYYIPHMTWPIVTLFKLHYINNFVNDDYDLLFYFNANCKLKKMNNILSQFLDNQYDMYFFTPKDNTGYFKTWGTKDNIYDKNLPYIQGTLFGGTKTGMKECCEYCINHINKLLLCNLIENKHDESKK